MENLNSLYAGPFITGEILFKCTEVLFFPTFIKMEKEHYLMNWVSSTGKQITPIFLNYINNQSENST